ncbi:MAG: 50S ribosomal protein L18 [Clostridiales bacterium]|nr:MAG: 50S ribosomal protein L18 [Clostridiales bacterium]
MISKLDKNTDRLARHARVRKKIGGTAERPRFDVYRSNMHIYVQVIDDVAGKTLAAASTVEKKKSAKWLKARAKTEAAKNRRRGSRKNARSPQASPKWFFDRGGYIYTGRVAAVADGAREAGLKF